MGVRSKRTTLTTGAVFDMPSALYHADPCAEPSLTSSIAHALISKSALHAWTQHPRLGGKRRPPTRSTDRGTIAHALLLGTADKELLVVQADDWRTKAAKDVRDAARGTGQVAVLQHELEDAAEAVRGIQKRLKALKIRLGGRSEVTLFWTETADDGTVVQCRGRLDHLVLTKARATILDLKTCRSAHPRSCRSHAYEYGYDIQAAAYRSGLAQVYPRYAGREEFVFLFAELEDPFSVTSCSPAGSLRELGARRWRRAVNLWATCVRTKTWPQYADRTVELEAPPYALLDEDDIAHAQHSQEV